MQIPDVYVSSIPPYKLQITHAHVTASLFLSQRHNARIPPIGFANSLVKDIGSLCVATIGDVERVRVLHAPTNCLGRVS